MTKDYEEWGFEGVYHFNNRLLKCPVCRSLVFTNEYDTKEASDWWQHIQWHSMVENSGSIFGFVWPVQPRTS